MYVCVLHGTLVPLEAEVGVRSLVTGVTDVDAITLALSCLGSYEISLDVSWCTASLNPLPCSLNQMNWKEKQGYSNN